MPLTPEDLRRVAALARIDVTAAEASALAAQLSDILERVERIDAEPGPGAGAAAGDDHAAGAGAPSGSAAGEQPGTRGDRPGADALGIGLEAVAPAWVEGFFTVPRLASHQDGAPGGEEAS